MAEKRITKKEQQAQVQSALHILKDAGFDVVANQEAVAEAPKVNVRMVPAGMFPNGVSIGSYLQELTLTFGPDVTLEAFTASRTGFITLRTAKTGPYPTDSDGQEIGIASALLVRNGKFLKMTDLTTVELETMFGIKI